MTPVRSWCCRCQYGDKDPFLLGTVFADSEMMALKDLERAMDQILPTRPNVLAVIPGGLFFLDREEQETGGKVDRIHR